MKHLRTVILFLALCLTGISSGQEITSTTYLIQGLVVDSLTHAGEPFVTLRIYPANNGEEPAAMLVSDNKGQFATAVKHPGDYRLIASSIGKKTVKVDFTVSRPTTRLGEILLAEDINQLGEVAIVAKKNLIKVDMDKIAYDVEEDPDSETKNVLDMMRKVPMITVDGEDNISLAGKSGVSIYVNGKPNTLITNNPKEVLKSMPASSVKNIEVITNPGAKYDAEGTGGIINLVTTEKHIEGYVLNVSGSYSGNKGYSGSLYGSTQVKKFTVSGGYSYNKYKSDDNTTRSTLEYLQTDKPASVITDSKNRFDGNFNNVFLDASYEIDTLNLISMSGSYYFMNNHTDNTGTVQALEKNLEPLYVYNTDSRNSMHTGGGHFSIDYQHTSPKDRQRTFVLSYRLNNTPNNSLVYTRFFNGYNYPDFEQKLKSKAFSLENTLQADYTLPVRKIHTFNFGTKYINRINDSKNRTLHRDSLTGSWTDSETQGSGKNLHRQHVLGVYAEYNLNYKKFGLKGGLRYEYTYQNVKFEQIPEQNFSTSFSDLVPSLLLSYNIGTTQNMTLGYNMRISRPGIYLLNPFRNNAESQLYVSYGNPNLNTEHYHTLNLSFGSFSPDFSISLSPEYSFCNDGVESYSFLDENQIINNTYSNIGRKHSAALNLFASWNPSKSTRLMLNSNVQYLWLYNNSSQKQCLQAGDKNKGFSCYLYGSVQQDLPWQLNLSCYGGYGKSGVTLNSVKMPGYYYYGMQLQRSFLKEEQLTVSLSASNFLEKTMKSTYKEKNPHYMNTTHNCRDSRYFSVSVSFKLGKLQASVKKAVKSITNTDVMNGGSGNSSSSSGMNQ